MHKHFLNSFLAQIAAICLSLLLLTLGLVYPVEDASVGYCRVVGNTTTVNTYIDIYCSRTVVLSTVAESRNLKCVWHWFHPSGVDQTEIGE